MRLERGGDNVEIDWQRVGWMAAHATHVATYYEAHGAGISVRGQRRGAVLVPCVLGLR